MSRRGTPVRDLDGLIRACVARRRELGLTQLQVDAAAGIQDGYCGKWEAGVKGLGRMSLGCILGALRLKLIVAGSDHRGLLLENEGLAAISTADHLKKIRRHGAAITNARHKHRKAKWGRKGALKRWRVWRAIKADAAARPPRAQ